MGKTKEFSRKFWKIVDKSLAGGSILLMGVMATLVVLTVFFRYVFNMTYIWSEEAIVLLFIATTYFGSVLCVKEQEHIDIPYFREKASRVVGFIMDIVVCAINLVIQSSLIYLSIEWIEKTGSPTSPGLHIPFYYIYSIFPLCFFLMVVYTARRLVKIIKKFNAEKSGGK